MQDNRIRTIAGIINPSHAGASSASPSLAQRHFAADHAAKRLRLPRDGTAGLKEFQGRSPGIWSYVGLVEAMET